MSKMKNWMMDMEESVESAIESGANTPNDVYTYVDSIHAYTDKSFVKKYAEELLGPECPN
jgi:hypothetical protein